MSQPFLGEIQIFAGTFAPQGWAFCNGAQVDISVNDTLYNLIGTTYGGDGQSNFNLPNLEGRAVLHAGTNRLGTTYLLGETGGQDLQTLTPGQIPQHTHSVNVSSRRATQMPAAGNVPASGGAYGATSSGTMDARTIAQAGIGNQFSLYQPYLAVNYIIALYGVYPQPN